MTIENESIDNIKYIIYNYFVNDLNYWFIYYIFSIYWFNSIRFDSICFSNQIELISQEWEIELIQFDLRYKLNWIDLNRCIRKSNWIEIELRLNRDWLIWFKSIIILIVLILIFFLSSKISLRIQKIIDIMKENWIHIYLLL